jgi:IS30 family transposase
MEELKTMKQNLTSLVQSQMGNLDQVNTRELGEAIDMIKDLSEAIYYCTITEAMEKSSENNNNNMRSYYYSEPSSSGSNSNGMSSGGNTSYYHE